MKLKTQMIERRNAFATLNSIKDTSSIPPEMLFASGSGLDPHISPEAALMQVDRIVASRHYTEAQKLNLLELIRNSTLKPQYLLFGEPRINVFELNLNMDNIK
jgi:K+-transporting ATPase ATPase C chain